MENIDNIQSLFEGFGIWTVVQIIFVIVVCIAIYQILKFVLPKLAEHLPTRFRIIVLNAMPIARLALVIIALVWIVPLIFNLTLRNVVLILSTVGVALGFALKDFATSTFAGIVAVIERPYRSGDWIRVGEDYGEVIEIGTRAFKLRTADDDVVTIPHSRIWTENIINSNNGAKTLMCVADFLVDPAAPTDDLKRVLRDVALTSPYLDWNHPVKVVMKNGIEGTRVKLRAYPFELRDQFDFITDLTERGRDALTGAGIRIIRSIDAAS